MKKEEFKINISKLLLDNSFMIQGDSQTIIFKQDKGISKREIVFGYMDFSPSGFRFRYPFIKVLFRNVEDILKSVYTRLNKNYIESGTIHKVLNKLEGVDYSVLEMTIDSNETFQKVEVEIQKIIQDGAIPFFEQYDTLEKVADLLADKTPYEVVPYIQGAILFPKTILILKLTNHPNFNEKLIEFYEVLKEQAEKKDTYKDILAVFMELFKEDLNTMV